MELQILRRNLGPEASLIELVGEVDIYTSPRLKATLQEALETGIRYFLVSLERVEMLDSTGLGALVGGRARARERGGDLALVCAQGRLLRLLQITGLRHIFRVYPDEEHFLAAYRAEGVAAFSHPVIAGGSNDAP